MKEEGRERESGEGGGGTRCLTGIKTAKESVFVLVFHPLTQTESRRQRIMRNRSVVEGKGRETRTKRR